MPSEPASSSGEKQVPNRSARDEAIPTSFFGRARHYVTHRVDPLTSLFLVLPLYVIYQIGVLLQMQCQEGLGCQWVSNGADFITRSMLEATHGSRLTFALISLGVGAGLFVAILWARRRSKLHPRLFVPVVLESALYASLVGPIIVMTQHAVGLGAPGQDSFAGDIVASFGAGLHEELIFRAVLFAGGIFVLQKLGVKPFLATVSSGLVSSIVFSAVHHLGALGEPFTVQAFVFRVGAGIAFATVYRVRGFAIAAWTHALYDIWVFSGQRFLGH
jgi:hypothetical protein